MQNLSEISGAYACGAVAATPDATGEKAASGCAAAAQSSGLVGTETSSRPFWQNVEFQRGRRLSRMKTATLVGSDCIEEQLQRGGVRWAKVFVTFTYRGVDDWRPNHLAEFFHKARDWAGRHGAVFAYLWVAELQRRGAVHYHALIWIPHGLTLPKPDKRGWWPHGFTRTERPRKPAAYMSKYASKGDVFQQFPKGLRLHGRAGLDLGSRRLVAYWCLPRYVRAVFSTPGEHVIRARGGGWVNHDTGEWLAAWSFSDA